MRNNEIRARINAETVKDLESCVRINAEHMFEYCRKTRAAKEKALGLLEDAGYRYDIPGYIWENICEEISGDMTEEEIRELVRNETRDAASFIDAAIEAGAFSYNVQRFLEDGIYGALRECEGGGPAFPSTGDREMTEEEREKARVLLRKAFLAAAEELA